MAWEKIGTKHLIGGDVKRIPSKETDHVMIELAPGVWIDEGIAPLIKALWDQGYETTFCCQGGTVHTTPGGAKWLEQAYVSFRSFDDGVRFMRHVHEVIGTRNYSVHHGLYVLTIGDNYGPDDKIDLLQGPSGCVRFPVELDGWDIMAITTDAFVVGDVALVMKEKEGVS